MKITPRPYQQESHDRLFKFLKNAKGHPVLEMPTGSGKSVVIAMICNSLNSIGYRAIILQRSGELIGQNMERLKSLSPELSIGAFSASLKSREVAPDFVFATIQSVADKALQFGQRNAIIVDECHQISVSENSQYQTFLRDMKQVNTGCRMIGLTATPYRLDNGPIVGDGMPFDGLAHRVPMKTLLDSGAICPLVSTAVSQIDTSGVRKSGWDYNKADVSSLFMDSVQSSCSETVSVADAKGAKSCLLFGTSIDHVNAIAENITGITGQAVGVITGDTLPLERASILADFKTRRLRWLVNCDVLTTGFDAPNIDLISVMRATLSAGLFSQICGRGMRTYEGKDQCWLLDFGGNVERHGPIDSEDYGHKKAKLTDGSGIAPVKTCPSCGDQDVPASARECTCGFMFPEREVSVNHNADDQNAVMEATGGSPWAEIEVDEIKYLLHRKEGKPDSMRVVYRAKKGDEMFAAEFSDWWCFEHEGVARKMAVEKWVKHSNNPCPETAFEAIVLADAGALAEPKKIAVKQRGKYWTVKTPSRLEKPPYIYHEDEEAPF
jgi:DNA repair protein RadD